MDASLIIYILAILLGVFAIIAFTRKGKVLAMSHVWAGILFLVIGAFLFAWQYGILTQISPALAPLSVSGTQIANDGKGGEVAGSNLNVAVNPSATYSTQDKFSTTSISGTSYYKSDGQSATTTALTNVNPNEKYVYWVQNTSKYYVSPIQFVGGTLNNPIVNKEAYANSSATVTGYDLVARLDATGGANNCSMSANDLCNMEITYQGSAKGSLMPFGGVLIVEYNSTVSSLTATGDTIVSSLTDVYGNTVVPHVTYTPNKLTSTYKVFVISPSIDDGSGTVKRITLQFKNGANPTGAGATWYTKFIPANYYPTNDGNIVLDVEKFANDDNTRTNLGEVSNTFGFGA